MDALREAFKAIDRAMTGDSRVLEVGCGSGEMAARIHALPGVSLVATDYSDDLVELTAARGVDARQADICYLPFDPACFDVVYAGWVLDQVRDIERALGEVRRVLRPGGTFVAVTDAEDGAAERRHRFSSQTGGRMLARRFDDVRRQDLETGSGDVTVFEAC